MLNKHSITGFELKTTRYITRVVKFDSDRINQVSDLTYVHFYTDGIGVTSRNLFAIACCLTKCDFTAVSVAYKVCLSIEVIADVDGHDLMPGQDVRVTELVLLANREVLLLCRHDPNIPGSVGNLH